jgi:4-aminobutyrate aminotransferase-like enzyme
MSQTTQESSTAGQRLADNPEIAGAIETIVEQLKAHSAEITDVRGPIEALGATYQAHLDMAAAVRGRPLLYPYIGSGLGNGALVELADGSVKWDMICGIGVHFFGHSEPDLIAAAVRAGLDDTVKHGNLQSNLQGHAFCETLLAEARKCTKLDLSYLATSGAMANENALKVCYQKRNGAPRIIAFKDCFMGRSIVLSQIGDSPGNRVGIPLSTMIDYMPFYDEVMAERVGATRVIDMAVMHLTQYLDRYPDQHACFIFELVQGEGGFRTATREYFKALMDVCKARGVPVWDDEIQTFGRLESMFACDMYDLGDYVDVMTVGKMSQACATLFTSDFSPKPGLLSGTFTGETVSFDVGRLIIERLRDGDYYGRDGRIARLHKLFREQVRAMAGRHPDWFPPVAEELGAPGVLDIVGGVGGMMRFSPFGGDKDKVVKACRACYDEGVVLFYCGHGPYHLRMLPALGVMREEDWPRVFECVERGLAHVA